MAVEYGSLRFEEQIQFFNDKLKNLIPTERWTDVWKDGHDTGFMVAGAMKADLLADLHEAVRKGIEDGTTLAEFRKDFKRLVAARGWTGWTGEGTKEGEAWRTRVIYDTNMYTSYAAGRYAQAKDIADKRPYWRYRHNDSVLHPRPLHVSWNGLTLRHDDPWWDTHFPPNGWGCKCYFETHRQPPAGARTDAPDDGEYEWRGETIPKGIDPGWDYAPGATQSERLRALVREKADGLPGPIGEALIDDVQDIRLTVAEIMNDPVFVESLAWFKDTAGWTSKPALLRDFDTGEVISRVGYLPKERWYRDYHDAFERSALTEDKFRRAIDRALAGKPLGKIQEATIEWLHEYHVAHFRIKGEVLDQVDELLDVQVRELERLRKEYTELIDGEGADWLQDYLSYVARQMPETATVGEMIEAQIKAVYDEIMSLK